MTRSATTPNLKDHGLTDATVAALWAGAGRHDLNTASAKPPAHQHIRDRLAVFLLAHVPGGRLLLRQVDIVRHDYPL